MAPKKAVGGGDAPHDKSKANKDIGGKIDKNRDNEAEKEDEEEFVTKTPSQIAREMATYRSKLRKEKFKRRWPEVTKVAIKTRPWHPPPPPERLPPIIIELPELTTRRWVPPYRRKHRRRPRLMRVPPEEITKPVTESSKLNKIWHNFAQVEANKMMLQGSVGCNSKRYSSTSCGAQTACIALIAKALMEEKPPSAFKKSDVDDIIAVGDSYYKRCIVALKCYKGKPQLQINQLLTSFYLHDIKYTFKSNEVERGVIAKKPDGGLKEPDLMELMQKRIGQTYCFILTVGNEKNFLIFGHPPTDGGSVKTIAYVFDPHMLDSFGNPHKLKGAGAFLRFAGIQSFVVDFLKNYAQLDQKKSEKPSIIITNIDICQVEPLEREPKYSLDLKALKIHCRSEWDSMNVNALIEQKMHHGQYPLASLSMVSLATSRATGKRKVKDFYALMPKEPAPALPMAPERGPINPTIDQIMSLRGENFFLYAIGVEGHAFGRDDLTPLPPEDPILHSPVDVADKNFASQYQKLDSEKSILTGTRHFASYRYQTFKSYTGVSCCVVALGMLKRLRARGWNEDTLDETLDMGYNYFRDSLGARGGPIRRLVLGELKDSFKIRDQEFSQKQKGISVWGKINSTNPKVFDLCRGLDAFFKESDSGVFQVPGEFESAIFNEGGLFYAYHPWPADRLGKLVGLWDGGKACILQFKTIVQLCDHFLASLENYSRRAFCISEVGVSKREPIPQPLNSLTPVAPGRWVIRSRFHEGDQRFVEEHRNKQATPMSIVALATAQLRDADDWTPDDVDEILTTGDQLYGKTMEHLERMGINLEQPKVEEQAGEEETEETGGTLAAGDVFNKFTLGDDRVEAEVLDSKFNGSLNPEPGSGMLSMEQAITAFFKKYSRGVVTARGASTGIWKSQQHLFMFDPHGCDENGYPSAEARAGAAVVRLTGGPRALAAAVLANLPAGADDSFNISPVIMSTARINPELAAPETKLESKQYEWIQKNTAAIMLGPRGEHSAVGKAAKKANITDEDKAGRALALPAAAAFAAASDSAPPQYMHQDHMFNCLDCGAEYLNKFIARTGRKEMTPEDLTEKFTMGANTFSLQLDPPIKLPLRLPDEPAGEGEEGAEEKELGEGEEEPEKMNEIKDLLNKMWNDYTKPSTVSLLVGDYHQMGVWMSPGGRVVVFDPAPTLYKGQLTTHRIQKGDEIRLQRIKDEMAGEGGGDEEDEEAGGEGEQQPEPEPEPVPKEACPALMMFSSPSEFIDKLTLRGPLDRKQCLAPYKLYPVTVVNELTAVLKEKKPPAKGGEDEEAAEGEEEEALVDPLEEAALGAHMQQVNRTTASVRGRLAQDENFFQESQRDKQDAANAALGIVVDHIEPYSVWKSTLIDAILKYGDRLYTLSLGKAADPPSLSVSELAREFHVTNFNVRLDLDGERVSGDLNAGETGSVLNLRRAIDLFLQGNKYGIICCKQYCVGIWKGADDKSCVLWEPHAVGPAGRFSPAGAAGLIAFSNVDQLAATVADNVRDQARPGGNQFTITPVKVFWEYSKTPTQVTAQGAVPDEGYEWKVLTAYVETARGRTILRGTKPLDLTKFARDCVLQSSASAVVAACMSHIRKSHLWTRNTVDEVISVGWKLFSISLGTLGYEFRPGDDVLLPLQVIQRFVLGVNYVRFSLEEVFSGKLEQRTPGEMNVKAALERFFESNTHGILWSVPHAVAVWRVAGAPAYYMMEPHACSQTGLRDPQDDGAACVLTFTSAKLMAYAYLQNYPVVDRIKHDFTLAVINVSVRPIKQQPKDSHIPIIQAPTGQRLVPATSKVGLDGRARRALESCRKHPPGSATCLDAIRASEARDKDVDKYKGQRNTSGWLVLNDGSQFLSAAHSMSCKKFPFASRGNQALACCVMSVAMSRVQDVCRWCGPTLDQILESGSQLHQDSFLHYHPRSRVLAIEQILRKFYTPGNWVCRVVIYQARQEGLVEKDLMDKVTEFFREERCGVFVVGKGRFSVALFKTPRGYYMFDPADRDRYGRAVAPPCFGKGRACFSQYPTVAMLVEKLGPNIPPEVAEIDTPASNTVASAKNSEVKFNEPEKEVRIQESAKFAIYGMDVTNLRRLNKSER